MHDERMASDADVYRERRRELAPSPEQPADADGDRRIALFVSIVDPAVVAAYERLRARLDDFPCLETPPTEGLHVTVNLFDCPPTVPAVAPDGGGSRPPASTRPSARSPPTTIRSTSRSHD